MTDRTYPTAEEAREAVLDAIEEYVAACAAVPMQSPGYKRAEAQWEADMTATKAKCVRAIERAQQAAVREALDKLPCPALGHAVCRAQQDAERALDALEEAR